MPNRKACAGKGDIIFRTPKGGGGPIPINKNTGEAVGEAGRDIRQRETAEKFRTAVENVQLAVSTLPVFDANPADLRAAMFPHGQARPHPIFGGLFAGR